MKALNFSPVRKIYRVRRPPFAGDKAVVETINHFPCMLTHAVITCSSALRCFKYRNSAVASTIELEMGFDFKGKPSASRRRHPPNVSQQVHLLAAHFQPSCLLSTNLVQDQSPAQVKQSDDCWSDPAFVLLLELLEGLLDKGLQI